MSALSDAPNIVRIGLANKKPTHISKIEHIVSIKKEVFMIIPALFVSLRPLSIEKIGAPPLPNKLLKAVIITIIGKHRFGLQYYKEDLKFVQSTSVWLLERCW